MSDRQRHRVPRRSAILSAAVLSCALLAPNLAALASEPAPQPAVATTAEGDAADAPVGRAGTMATKGTNRSVRQRGAAAPVELSARPEPTPEQRRSSSQGDAGASAGDAKGGDRAKVAKKETPSRVWPLEKGDYTFTQPFGCVPQLGGFYRTNPGCPADSPAVHGGIDLAAPEGTRIYAAASGWVTEAGLDREVGLANTRLVIQHDGENDGYATEYLHWITSFVRVGDYVRAGEPIAEVGSVGWSTGPHLHFAVIEFATGDFSDPVRWLPKTTDGDVYRGLEPGRRPQQFDRVSANMPEHADPAPPPLPKRERVPDSPPAEAESESDGKDPEKREKRQRKAERRERQRAERAEARAADQGASEETGDGGRDSNAPEDQTGAAPAGADESATAEPDDAADSGKDRKDRKRDRARDEANDNDGKKRDGRNKDRNDSGQGKDDGGKDDKDRNKDKGSGKGDGGGRNDGGKDDSGKGGKKRDKHDDGTEADIPADAPTPETDPGDESGEPIDPGNEATDPDPADPADLDVEANVDAADQVAGDRDDGASGDAGATDAEPKSRKRERAKDADPAA